MANDCGEDAPLNSESTDFVEHCVFGIAQIEIVRGLLLNGKRTRFLQTWETQSRDPDPYHPLGQWSTLVTRANPAVIYDDGAAFCSPVIVFDSEGNALHFHDSLIDKRLE